MGVNFAAARRNKRERYLGPMRVVIYEGPFPTITMGNRVPHFDFPLTRQDGNREPAAELFLVPKDAVFPEIDRFYPNKIRPEMEVDLSGVRPINSRCIQTEGIRVDWLTEGRRIGASFGIIVDSGVRPKAEMI